MYSVGIIGGGGFTGKELVLLLNKHPYFRLQWITSNVYQGKKIHEVFPQLGKENIRFSPHPNSKEEIPQLDLIFLCTPEEASLKYIPWLKEKNICSIDLSQAYRLEGELLYAIPEISAKEIPQNHFFSNPGCYPISVLIPLFLLKEYLSYFHPRILIHSASGTSGRGGRKEKDSLSFSSIHENFYPYRVKKHAHTPEIKKYLDQFSSQSFHVRFTPHLLPIFRGILSSIYLFPKEKALPEEKIKNHLKEKSSLFFFVRYVEDIEEIHIQRVVNTNFLDFSFYYDKENQVFMICSVIDNLLKGASGNALQVANLRFSLEESIGLL